MAWAGDRPQLFFGEIPNQVWKRRITETAAIPKIVSFQGETKMNVAKRVIYMFLGGVVAYSNASKQEMLGVSASPAVAGVLPALA